MGSRPRPLESFAPGLMTLLLKGTVEPQVIYAEPNNAPPQILRDNVHPFKPDGPNGEGARIRRTRWHTLLFPTELGAQRFTKLLRLAAQLHSLRRAMTTENHPDAKHAWRAKVSVDEKRGALKIEPVDNEFSEILGTETLRAKPLAVDPLETL